MKDHKEAAADKDDLKQKLRHIMSIGAQIIHENVEHSIHLCTFKVLYTKRLIYSTKSFDTIYNIKNRFSRVGRSA